MPRLPRLHVPGGCYHAVLRGNHREDLFSTADDRHVLNDIVAEAMIELGARVHAFCWMTNHIHLLVQIGERPLGKLMQRVATRYSRYRHRQLRTTGHLFERRYKAWLVDADVYFITLLRYIHLNPVRASMVQTAAEYRWSSHRAYIGEEVLPWLTLEFGLSLFGKTVESARSAYRTLIAQPIYASEGRVLDETHPDDSRVLGTDRFLASLPSLHIKPRSPLMLLELAEQVCAVHGVTLDMVRSRARHRELTATCIDIARQALDGRITSSNEVARFLGRSPSSLSELLKRYA